VFLCRSLRLRSGNGIRTPGEKKYWGDEFAALHDDLVDHTGQQILIPPLPAMAVRPGGIDGDSYVASTTRRHTVAGSRRKQGTGLRAGYELQSTREIPAIIVEAA
jgi:hypothetical protein